MGLEQDFDHRARLLSASKLTPLSPLFHNAQFITSNKDCCKGHTKDFVIHLQDYHGNTPGPKCAARIEDCKCVELPFEEVEYGEEY